MSPSKLIITAAVAPLLGINAFRLNVNPLSLSKQKAEFSDIDSCYAKQKEADETEKCKAEKQMLLLTSEGEGDDDKKIAVYELMGKEATTCEEEYEPLAEDECEKAGKQLVIDAGKEYPARGLQVGSGGSCNDGGWGNVPPGCSLQTGGDWAPHFQKKEDKKCKADSYQLICKKMVKGGASPAVTGQAGVELCASFKHPYKCVNQGASSGCAWRYAKECSPAVGSCISWRNDNEGGVSTKFNSCHDYRAYQNEKGKEAACAGSHKDKQNIIDKLYCGQGLPESVIAQEKAERDEYDCQDGDVRLSQDSPLEPNVSLYTEVSYKGKWYPICGHWLWNNNHAASYVCKKLGFSGGGTVTNWWQHGKAAVFEKDAMPIGECSKDMTDLTGCTKGGNGWGNLDLHNGGCRAGHEIGVGFRCSGTPRKTGKRNSCGRIQLKYVQQVGHDWVTASCPKGLLAIGGGCDSAQHPWKQQANAPAKGGDFVGNDDEPWGWRCGGHGTRKVVWAVCSNLKNVKARVKDQGDWDNNYCKDDETVLSGGCLAKDHHHIFSWNLSTGPGEGTGWRCGGHSSHKKNWVVCSSDPRLKPQPSGKVFKKVVQHGGDWNHVNCGPGWSVVGGGCDSTQPPHIASWMGPKMDGTGYLCGGHSNNKLGEARCILNDMVDRV